MKYFFVAFLLFFSSINFVYAGTWSAPVNHPTIPPPTQFCDDPPLYPTSQMPTGSSCSPDGTTYTFGQMSTCSIGPGEFGLYQNANNVQQQTCNPSANNPPTANAGIDRTITQPTASFTISSGASASDPDGSVASTVWTFVSMSVPGPSPTIANSTTLTPTFNGMSTAAVYTFRLRVTDNGGLFTDDTMTVTVNVANPQCSDGINNDSDSWLDSQDWGCHSDNNAVNASSYVPTDNDESNLYCNVPGWGPEQLVYDGDLSGPGGVGWCNGTAFGACPASQLGGGPNSLSAKGNPNVCCRGEDYLGYIRQCNGSPPQPVDAVCGSAASTTVPSEPSGTDACAAGTYLNSPADTSTNWNWTCDGLNSGADALCTATKTSNSCAPTVGGSDIICAACPQPGDNVYPTIAGTDIGQCPGNVYPATLQQGTKCTYGSQFEPDYRGSCDCTVFEYAAAPASCSAPVNGTCGPGAGNVTPTEPTGLSACSSGTYENNPADTGASWNWTCRGANGGANPSCSATKSSSVPTAGCPYGVQATQTYSARAMDETNSYDNGNWGIWAPVCASDTGWDSPHMNNAQSFAATPAYGVPAGEVSTFQSAMSSWFPQPGVWEEHDSTTGSTTRLSWALDQWTGSQPDLIPCFAQVTIDVCNVPPNYTLTTAISPGSSGTVTAPNISCPGDCTESYVVNTMVTVVATPSAGYAFSSWGGACSGQPSSCSLQMDGNKDTTANFVLSPAFDYSITNSGASNVTKQAGDAYTTNIITRTLSSGATEAVTMTATGMPAGVTPAYDASRACSPTCQSTITFTVANSTAAGTYPITVTSTVVDGNPPGSKQTVFNLVVTAPAGLSVTCAANPTSAMIGDNITWTATVVGGTGPYTYSWVETPIQPGPPPTTSSFVRKYDTIGQKSASVTVTDAGSFQAFCNPAAVTQINFDPSFEEF